MRITATRTNYTRSTQWWVPCCVSRHLSMGVHHLPHTDESKASDIRHFFSTVFPRSGGGLRGDLCCTLAIWLMSAAAYRASFRSSPSVARPPLAMPDKSGGNLVCLFMWTSIFPPGRSPYSKSDAWKWAFAPEGPDKNMIAKLKTKKGQERKRITRLINQAVAITMTINWRTSLFSFLCMRQTGAVLHSVWNCPRGQKGLMLLSVCNCSHVTAGWINYRTLLSL